MRQIVIKHGLLSGLIVSVWLFLAIFISMGELESWGMVAGFASMILSFSLIFVAIRKFRSQAQGKITFGQAFLIGFFISLIATICYVLVWEIDFNFFIPDFFDKYTENVIAHMKQEGKPAAEVQKLLEEMTAQGVRYKSDALYRMGLTSMEIFPVGILVSLIAAGLAVWRQSRENRAV